MNRAADQPGLVLQTLSYSAYGHSVEGSGTSLGFNGERRSGVLHGYGLGNGHRFYRPALMRFLSPDALSPFGKGGVNSYAYCQCDPVNRLDPTGGYGFFSLFPVPPELKTGPGRYVQARITSMEFVEVVGSGSSELLQGAQRRSYGVPDLIIGGPSFYERESFWKEVRYWEHRPATEPMSVDQMVPNHQRAQSSEIGNIERRMVLVREQQEREEVVNRVFVFGDVS
ncbi:RHS repeat-associated core domain-containing protein [Pseudomonas sp. LAIL14HWK12:I11]|nr:RHS repeat-associated core domain-containing protein [Pseudomonas sp. LAIL14HWK12:I11]SMR72519.1 RHS repeat-associated core domain-containing protein [Pseudomonas sp. LAIL14HWK12:I10]SOD01422.1 RHS repeat-associated core domain-containing protein [Pseudomonas sp. LAIL14HWK12:I8]